MALTSPTCALQIVTCLLIRADEPSCGPCDGAGTHLDSFELGLATSGLDRPFGTSLRRGAANQDARTLVFAHRGTYVFDADDWPARTTFNA